MPLRIYYLDDEVDLLEMFSETFSSPEREITTFSDPKTAIDAMLKNPPDILFIDYRLPNYKGDQIAKMLDPNIPKILITGDIQLKGSYNYNFVAVFEKPFNTSKIEEIIEKLKRDIQGDS